MNSNQFFSQQYQQATEAKDDVIRDLQSVEVFLVGGGEAAGCLN